MTTLGHSSYRILESVNALSHLLLSKMPNQQKNSEPNLQTEISKKAHHHTHQSSTSSTQQLPDSTSGHQPYHRHHQAATSGSPRSEKIHGASQL